jgi:hypothetical protein
MIRKKSRRKRIVGPNPSSRFCHHGPCVSSGWAFTTTPFTCSRRDSSLLSAKAGISVLKSVVGFDPAYESFCVNVPWIAVPFEVISFTCPALTWSTKKGL